MKSGPLSFSDDKLGIRICVLRDQKASLYARAVCNPEPSWVSGGFLHVILLWLPYMKISLGIFCRNQSGLPQSHIYKSLIFFSEILPDKGVSANLIDR